MELNLTNAATFAENLRSRLLSTKPALIKSRRQLFRSYPNTFVGSEVVDWMIKESNKINHMQNETNNNGEISNDEENSQSKNDEIDIDSDTLSQAMQKLLDFGILRSVHGDFPFKADSTIYRFTSDDTTCPGVVEALVKGCRLHKSTSCADCALLQRVCEYGELVSDQCMRGSDLISWILHHSLATNREDAKRVCRLMYEHSILKPATKQVTEFVDGKPFYLFGVNFDAPPLSIQQFVSLTSSGIAKATEAEAVTVDASSKQSSSGSHVRQLSGQLTDLSIHGERRRKNTSSSSVGSDDSGYMDFGACSTSPSTSSSYTSLLASDGKLTPEALMHPCAPFEKKEIRIYPDPVGYGFIVRGSSPCYVKIVDPESPAGKCGLKKHQYITEINSRDVTKKNYQEVEDLILNGPRFLMITVMLPKGNDEETNPDRAVKERKFSGDAQQISHSHSDNSLRRASVPTKPTNAWPTAQPWMKQRKASDIGLVMTSTNKFIR